MYNQEATFFGDASFAHPSFFDSASVVWNSPSPPTPLMSSSGTPPTDDGASHPCNSRKPPTAQRANRSTLQSGLELNETCREAILRDAENHAKEVIRSPAAYIPPPKFKSQSPHRQDETPHIRRPANSYFIFRTGVIESEYIPPEARRDQAVFSRFTSEQWKILPGARKRVFWAAANAMAAAHRVIYPDYKFQPKKKNKRTHGLNGGGVTEHENVEKNWQRTVNAASSTYWTKKAYDNSMSERGVAGHMDDGSLSLHPTSSGAPMLDIPPNCLPPIIGEFQFDALATPAPWLNTAAGYLPPLHPPASPWLERPAPHSVSERGVAGHTGDGNLSLYPTSSGAPTLDIPPNCLPPIIGEFQFDALGTPAPWLNTATGYLPPLHPPASPWLERPAPHCSTSISSWPCPIPIASSWRTQMRSQATAIPTWTTMEATAPSQNAQQVPTTGLGNWESGSDADWNLLL